jgi:hypothetical protein
LGTVSTSDEFQDGSISLTFAPAILTTVEVPGVAGAESTVRPTGRSCAGDAEGPLPSVQQKS